MKFNFYVYLDNAAFEDNPSIELARIMRETADKIEQSGEIPKYYQNVRDYNGNIIGRYAAKPKMD
ncbi:MAG: hypothetical protein LC100_15325 [Chitinophagales bacterium]|nr:hypothetical protein [Chitinophagales bacterium]